MSVFYSIHLLLSLSVASIGFTSAPRAQAFYLEGCWEVYAAPLQVAMQLRDYNPPCDVTPTDLTHATVYNKPDPANTWLRLGTTTTLSVSVSPPELTQGATFSWSVNSKLRIMTLSTTCGLWNELPLEQQPWITTDSTCVVLAKELSDSISDAQAYCAFSNTITSPTASGPPATQPIDFDGNPSTPNEFVFPITVFDMDLDIDSDNNSAVDSVTSKPLGPSRSIEEDAIEDIANDPDHPGKVVMVNDGDSDGDGVPDYADGLDIYTDDGITTDAYLPSHYLTPVVLALSPAFPPDARIRIEYPASDPAQMIRRVNDSTSLVEYILPEQGSMRLWMHDVETTRCVASVREGGDYLAPTGTTSDIDYYTTAELGFSATTGTVTFYAEAVKVSAETGDLRIVIYVKPNSDSTEGFQLV